MISRGSILAAALVTLAGCHDFDAAHQLCLEQGRCYLPDSGRDAGSDAGSDAGLDAGPGCALGPISGQVAIHWALEDSGINTPAPFLEVIAGTCDGGAQEFSATLDGDGGFLLPEVPAGRLVFHTRGSKRDVFVMTSERQLTLDLDALGRPDQQPCDAGTQLALTFSGLTAWNFLTDFGVMAPNAGIRSLTGDQQGFTANAPIDGDVALNQATFSYFRAADPTPLVDATRGDSAVFYQSTVQPGLNGGPNYIALTKALRVSNLTILDGQLNSVSGAVMDMPVAGEMAIRFSAPAFQSFLPDNPAASLVTLLVGVSTQPPGTTLAEGERSIGLNVTFFGSGTGVTEADMQYAQPFPGWDATGTAGYVAQATYAVPFSTGTQNVKLLAGMNTGALASSWSVGANPVVGPQVGPPQALSVNGLAAYTIMQAVGFQPTLSWSPPALGTPSYYAVGILELPSQRRVANIYLAGTSVQVPAGLLQPGTFYAFNVRATFNPASTPARPFVPGFPFATAENFTAPVSP